MSKYPTTSISEPHARIAPHLPSTSISAPLSAKLPSPGGGKNYTLAVDIATDLLNLRDGTPDRQRLDALESACHTLTERLGNNRTLADLEHLCRNYCILIGCAGLPGYPAAAKGVALGGVPAIYVYELESPTTRKADGTTLGLRIARLIASLICPAEYSTLTEEQDDYGTCITLHPVK